MRFPRVVAAITSVLAAGSSAGAVTLSMSTDASVYTVGTPIVLTLNGDTTGAAAALVAFVVINYSDPSLVDGVDAVATQDVMTFLGGQLSWDPSALLCEADRCQVINQIAGIQPQVPDPEIIVGTLTVPTVAPGVLELYADPVTFFGAAAPPAITVTIVPEPATAGLLGVGLLGIALARRTQL